MEYKCKICAGSLTIDLKSRVAVCDYCGTKQTLPLFGDDSSKALYERGNQYLLHNEYDKAESVFTQLLSVNPNDSEIYWNLVLCRYGVTYAKDPQTGRYIPTCNRTQTDSVLKDENYLRALELSVGEKAELYIKDASIIEGIQKGILDVSRKEKPFDIFISYKETDANGNRTRDSIEAQKLYEKLTELGYKVFYSRITLESKIGEEYEPYIYAALSSSKVMITVCSSKDNIESAWVKNEWNRYLTLRRGDTSKTLIPVYYDMNESELPEEFALLSAQNMRADDFEQELIRGIKKLIPTPIILKEKREKTRKSLLTVGIIAIAVGLPIILLVTIPARRRAENEKQYNKAQELFDAGKYDEASAIYEELGDFEDASELVVKCANILGYEKAQELFAAGNYDEAKLIYDNLGDYEDAAEMAVKCTYQADFDDAMQLYYDQKYPEAVWALQAIGDFDEVKELQEKCEIKWRERVSTIAYSVLTRYEGGGPNGYIDTNGTVRTFADSAYSLPVEVKVNSSGEKIGESHLIANDHGEVTSISYGYALYEDGHVSNSAYLNNLESDWENVIQISDFFEYTNIALLNDGTIIYGANNLKSAYTSDVSAWLAEVDEWSNIVKIDWAGMEEAYITGNLTEAVIAALDSEGKMHIAAYKDQYDMLDDYKQSMDKAEQYFNGIARIVDLSIAESYISAIDAEKTMHVYDVSNGKTDEIADVKKAWGKYYIDSKNSLKTIDSNSSVLEGVVYLNDGYCVTQSGAIYKCDGSATDGKTAVKDVWIER